MSIVDDDSGFWAEFDRYCEEHGISPEETPAAFGAWLNQTTGWDGTMERVDPPSEEMS